MKNAVIYSRVSTAQSKSGACRQNTARQVSDLEAFADANGIAIQRVFEEHVSGAKKIEERPILKECIDYCIYNHISVLLVSELSRLGRSTLQVLRALELLHDAKVSVYVQNLGIYTLQEDGKINPVASILVTVLSEMGNIERTLISERLNSGRAKYLANGGKLGRKVGYRKSIDEFREEYRETITLLRKGVSIRNVAKITGHDKATVLKVRKLFLSSGAN